MAKPRLAGVFQSPDGSPFLPAVPRFDGIDGPALESQASGRTNRNYSL